jgi:hypothetical protein
VCLSNNAGERGETYRQTFMIYARQSRSHAVKHFAWIDAARGPQRDGKGWEAAFGKGSSRPLGGTINSNAQHRQGKECSDREACRRG